MINFGRFIVPYFTFESVMWDVVLGVSVQWWQPVSVNKKDWSVQIKSMQNWKPSSRTWVGSLISCSRWFDVKKLLNKRSFSVSCHLPKITETLCWSFHKQYILKDFLYVCIRKYLPINSKEFLPISFYFSHNSSRYYFKVMPFFNRQRFLKIQANTYISSSRSFQT